MHHVQKIQECIDKIILRGVIYQDILIFKDILITVSLIYHGASLVAQLVKNLPAMREIGFNPWVRKIPCRRKWHSIPGIPFLPFCLAFQAKIPIPVFLPGKSHGQRSLAGI